MTARLTSVSPSSANCRSRSVFLASHLYVGNTNAVVRFRYKPRQTKAEGKAEKITELPGTGYHEHWRRNVVFSPKADKLYVTVGSESNVDVERDPMRAAITEINPDGSAKESTRADCATR